MADTGKKIEKAKKKVAKGEASKDKKPRSPESGPLGGGSSEMNESAGSRVDTHQR